MGNQGYLCTLLASTYEQRETHNEDVTFVQSSLGMLHQRFITAQMELVSTSNLKVVDLPGFLNY